MLKESHSLKSHPHISLLFSYFKRRMRIRLCDYVLPVNYKRKNHLAFLNPIKSSCNMYHDHARYYNHTLVFYQPAVSFIFAPLYMTVWGRLQHIVTKGVMVYKYSPVTTKAFRRPISLRRHPESISSWAKSNKFVPSIDLLYLLTLSFCRSWW